MKKFLTMGGVIATICSTLPLSVAAVSPTTVGMHARDYFRTEQQTVLGSQTPVVTQAETTQQPLSAATSSSTPMRVASSNEGTTIVGIQTDGTTKQIASFVISDNIEVNAEHNLASGMTGGISQWQTGSFSGSYYYIVGTMGFLDQFFVLDGSTWQTLGQNNIFPGINTVGLTYSDTDNINYGIFANNTDVNSATEFYFSTFDFGTGPAYNYTKTDVATLTQKFVAIASSKDGTVYAIGGDGNLYTIDKASGAETLVGSTGIIPGLDRSSACFNNAGDAILWVEAQAIYAIDTTTGSATKLADVPGVWTGIYVRPEEAAVTPSWIDDLEIKFTDDALTGNITFKMPATDTSGNALSGSLTYHVNIDGKEFASAEAEAGSTVVVPATLTEGTHIFQAYASLNKSEGYAVQLNRFIGHDTPLSPGNINVVEKDNVVTVSWSPVSEGINKGFINNAAMAYTVTRMPGNVTVAENTTATSIVDDQIVSLNKYTYSIIATDGVKASSAAVSGPHLLGEAFGIIPPYEYGFGAEGMGLFTQVNANNDAYAWSFDSGSNVVWLPSNPDEATDDWLFSPKFKLDGDSYYRLMATLQGSQYLEKQLFEIMMGDAPTPEAMTKVAVPKTQFDYAYRAATLVKPEASGEYYFGIHVTTPAVTGAIAISNFTVGEAIHTDSPNAVANYQAHGAADGAKSVHITFDTPKKTFGGNPLESLTKIVVTNATTGVTLKEYENPGINVELALDDENPAEGLNEYTIICYNENGAGPSVSVSTWVGLDVPAAPGNVRWQQKGEEVTLSWTAPANGAHKGFIDPSKLTYNVLDANKNVIREGLTELSVTLTPELDSSVKQIALQYAVVAVNEAGESSATKSNSTAFGKGYEAPFAESFELAQTHTTPWVVECVENYNYFMPATDIIGLPIRSYDDEGMLVYAAFSNGVARFCFPIIDMSKLQTPALKFYVYYMDANTTFNVVASHDSGLTWEVIGQTVPNKVLNRWHMASVDLTKLAGEKEARIALQATSAAQGLYVCLDKFRIDNNLDCDLMLTDLVLPDKIQAGNMFDVQLTAVNNGLKPLGDYTVDFSVNGVVEKSMKLGSLEPAAFKDINVELPLSSNAAGLNLVVTANYEGDENVKNNELSGSTMVLRSRFPEPTGLANGSTKEGVIELTWNTPASTYNATVVDDLESYEPSSTGGIDAQNNIGKIGNYTLIDNDRMLTTYVHGVSPSLTPSLGKQMACNVIDMDHTMTGSTLWAAHSGKRIFCFWQSMDKDGSTEVANDDYLITPRLDEEDARFSFWAKTLTDKYQLASFEIMVSFTGTEIDDFIKFQEVKNVPAEYAAAAEKGYTYYEFELPEGTAYAAIHYTGFDSSALLVDDLSYTPADNAQQLTLKGYNVYRNGARINAEPVTDPKFTDVPAEPADYLYNVTSVFAEGESRYSNGVNVKVVSGIENATADSAKRIYAAAGQIVVTGYNGETISVYTPDGRLVASAEANAVTNIPVPSGIYLVKAGNDTASVAVK